MSFHKNWPKVFPCSKIEICSDKKFCFLWLNHKLLFSKGIKFENFRQGSFGETFYIILDGKVQVSQKQKGYIRTLSGSDYFGEKALLNEASVR